MPATSAKVMNRGICIDSVFVTISMHILAESAVSGCLLGQRVLRKEESWSLFENLLSLVPSIWLILNIAEISFHEFTIHELLNASTSIDLRAVHRAVLFSFCGIGLMLHDSY
jgi:hypothetical protein